jgi:tetratricopeptide (TPR) repeat protein
MSAFILFKLPTTNKQETQDKELADYEKVLTMPYKRMPIIYNVFDYLKFSVAIWNPRWWSEINLLIQNIGYVYYEKENYEKALEYYSKSIAQCPYHVRAYYNRYFSPLLAHSSSSSSFFNEYCYVINWSEQQFGKKCMNGKKQSKTTIPSFKSIQKFMKCIIFAAGTNNPSIKIYNQRFLFLI